MINNQKPWSPEHIAELARIYPTTPTPDLVPVFGRSVHAIQSETAKHGIKKCPVWLKAWKSALSKATLEKQREKCEIGFRPGNELWQLGMAPTDKRKPKRILTQHGHQDIETVPGGRVITHTLGDQQRKAA